ncbi:MAG TPA: hypothetical protein VGT07_15125 [Steroidobacteraceae bacterium]|nr:hypothetical protein [Steroidobacteraceae bacterium]
MRGRSAPLIAALMALLSTGAGSAQAADPTAVAAGETPEQRAIAAILRDCNPRTPGAEHPLPLAASWSMGLTPLGFSPAWQVEQIRRGQYLLPWFWLGVPPTDPPSLPGYSTVSDALYYGPAISYLARHGLPLGFDMPPWEVLLPRVSPVYAKKTDSSGHPISISPFGPIRRWYEAGRAWTRNPSLLQLQRLYPDPPLVLFISDNESSKLTPDDLHEPYSVDPSPHTIARRRAIGDAWIARYKAMSDGLRDGLQAPGWRAHALFIGYDAFVTSAMGRWGGWGAYSLYVPGRTEPWPYAWDGASVSYYVHDWAPDSDYTVWSPEIEAMNYVPVLAEVRREEPDFWFEISTWDGQQPGQPSDKLLFYAKRGQTYSPDRYGGMVQFGMWLLRPRVVRDFRNSLDDERIRFGPYFDRIMEAVARVHRNPVLRDFWQHGHLVANPVGGHPYEVALTPELASRPRWFLLDSPANPPRPWELTTPLAVYALALVRGRAPHREWLVYAFSPLERSEVVRVRIPGGPEATVRAASRGAFTRVQEGNPPVTFSW